MASCSQKSWLTALVVFAGGGGGAFLCVLAWECWAWPRSVLAPSALFFQGGCVPRPSVARWARAGFPLESPGPACL